MIDGEKMNDIIKMIRELKAEMLKAVFLDSFLDAGISFLAIFLMLSLFNYHPVLAIIPAVLILIFLVFKRMRSFRLRTVEDRNPVIKEMLRTAADNADKDNYVIRALNSELVKKMKLVASSSLMKMNKIIYKLVAIVVLSFLIVYITATQLLLFDINKLLHPPLNIVAKEGSIEDLFGDKTDIPKIGQNPVDIKLNPLSYEVNIDKIDEAKPKEFKSDFPLEVYAAQEKSFDENIPREQQVIVKNYFSSIRSQ